MDETHFHPEGTRYPVVSTQTRLLESRVFTSSMIVSEERLACLRGAELRVAEDWCRSQLLVSLRASVLAERSGEESWTVTEGERYCSPRHAFLASLRYESLWRRFLAYFWGIDPRGPVAERVRHEVTATRWTTYPEATIVPELGRPRRLVEMTSQRFTDDAYRAVPS